MILEVLDIAEADLLEVHSFYERQSEGVGDYFIESHFADVESCRLYAGSHPVVFGFHRLLAAKFPFAVYYWMNRKNVSIWRVLDCRMAPANIRGQLQSLGK